MPMWMPNMPHSPLLPSYPGYLGQPDYPGYPAFGSAAMQPSIGSGAFPGGEGSPLSQMAARGVPISLTEGGRPFLRGGMNGHNFGLPPQIAGMPQMPGPPPGFFGGAESSGLFHQVPPAMPFGQAFSPSSLT